MLTILMIILIHLCIVAINITLSLWVILSNDNTTELHFKKKCFCIFYNILSYNQYIWYDDVSCCCKCYMVT